MTSSCDLRRHLFPDLLEGKGGKSQKQKTNQHPFLPLSSRSFCFVVFLRGGGGGDVALPKVVQWLHEHRSEGCTTKAMNEAAAGGHLETVPAFRNLFCILYFLK